MACGEDVAALVAFGPGLHVCISPLVSSLKVFKRKDLSPDLGPFSGLSCQFSGFG
jgi:hypothetical protein